MSKSRKEQIEEMLRDDPSDHELRYMLGMEHVSAGDDAGAAKVFHELINPHFPALRSSPPTSPRLRSTTGRPVRFGQA